MKLTLALATACALFAAPAFAQSPTTPQTKNPAQTTGVAPANAPISTRDFVNRVIMSDMFDTRAAKIAEQKGDSSDRNFARQEAAYHPQLTDELKSMVNSGKVKDSSIPTALDSEHQQRLDQLQKLSGKQFDEAFKKDAAQNHENLVSLLEQYSRNGTSADLKQWASKTLPQVDAERPRGSQVDDELEPDRLHDRQVGRLGALEDTGRPQRPHRSR
jgi:putative membrane protein